MTLDELLKELRYNILRDRSDLFAGDSDSLWSDETLLLYLKDAESRFARQSLCIQDSTTPEITEITLREGVQTYPAHASVLGVLSARFDTDSFDIQRSGHSIILQFTPPELLSYDPNAAYEIPPGRPIAYFTDETLVYGRQGGVTVSVYPTPGTDEAGKKLHMRVLRLPTTIYDLSTSADDESEIPEGYQLDALEWAAYRALRGFDADAGAPDLAAQHRTAFEDAVKAAVKETKRKKFANASFQFGTNGFSYVR